MEAATPEEQAAIERAAAERILRRAAQALWSEYHATREQLYLAVQESLAVDGEGHLHVPSFERWRRRLGACAGVSLVGSENTLRVFEYLRRRFGA